MKKVLVMAVSALCVSSSAVFATGDGGGPIELSQSPNAFPRGFFVGTPEYIHQQELNKYFTEQSRRAAALAAAERGNTIKNTSETH